jgi:DNA polymerase I-like protein with 3'-5' exonuclease and polymerase domains
VDEYEYLKKNSTLQPLSSYNFILDPSYDSLILLLRSLRTIAPWLSVDIETLRPKKNTEQFPLHPGFPYTIALAWSIRDAVSFPLWHFTNEQFVNILRELQWLFLNKIIIGQNFFSFDLNFLEAFFGFQFDLTKIRDTKLRHHILWPELPHKLQFLCKQYTRQSYYKDEGKGFSPRSKVALLDFLRYGALDVVVTAEVYEGQEEEFKQRPHLR